VESTRRTVEQSALGRLSATYKPTQRAQHGCQSTDQNHSETAQNTPDSGQRIARSPAALTAPLYICAAFLCRCMAALSAVSFSVKAHQHGEAISPLTSDRIGGGLSGFWPRRKPRAYFYWETRNWEFWPHSAKGDVIAPKENLFIPKDARNKTPVTAL